MTPPVAILSDRVIVVAGGTGNVGRVLVRGLLDAGATVVVPSRSTTDARHLTTEPTDDRLLLLHGNVADDRDAGRIRDAVLERFQRIDGVVATLGHFIPAKTLLEAPRADLELVLESYPVAHFVVARTFLPELEKTAGAYVFINGPLAFDPAFPGTGLVSVATAAQAMLARIVMKDAADARSRARINEVVLYTFFGPQADRATSMPVSHADVARYIVSLLSPANELRGRTLHLDSPAALDSVATA
jgi:NAD(P)-dependent dehydrogenase (short-subunit alcohol dehydrogenase family)